MPQRHGRGRRAAGRGRPGGLAVRPVRRHPAVLLRPGHGRARGAAAGPAAAGACLHRAGHRAGRRPAGPGRRLRAGRAGYFRGAGGAPAGRSWTRTRRCGWPPSTGTIPRPAQGRPVRRRGVAGVRARESPPGTARGDRAARAGTPSARRWRCTRSARPSTSTPGGADLRFPHHAYQAALAEAFTGVTPFARARLNVGVVSVAGAKMAKSTGQPGAGRRPARRTTRRPPSGC